MRSLTDAEGRVVAVLLGAGSTNERARLARAGTPRSTYHAARRRAYEEGWLRDRYVPDPVRFGYSVVTFALVRPFADRLQELTERWTRDPANVLTWTSPQASLGVFFHRDQESAARFSTDLADGRMSSGLTVVSADASGPEIPAYFDYEGLWTHLAAVSGNLAYPTGLGGRGAEVGTEPAELTPHQLWAATELVQRPFLAASQGRPGHLVGPLGLAFSQQNVLRRGWVTHRVFLEPARLPPYQGRSADHAVFVTGSLRENGRPESLFAALTRDCRVFPFLYAAHGGRVLLGALGRGPPSPSPSPVGGSTERRSVMATLQASLEGIEVVQDPVTSFRSVVDHRYDRVLNATARHPAVG